MGSSAERSNAAPNVVSVSEKYEWCRNTQAKVAHKHTTATVTGAAMREATQTAATAHRHTAKQRQNERK